MSDFRIATLANGNSGLTQAQGDLAIQRLRNPATKASPSKIDKAAHDFESILVGQWLEKAEKSFATVPGGDPDKDQDSGHDQFQSIACQFMAQGLSKSGGFGIAAMISKHLTAAEAKPAENGPKIVSGSSPQLAVSAAKSQSDK
jgi:Rod binding domain-containing protein